MSQYNGTTKEKRLFTVYRSRTFPATNGGVAAAPIGAPAVAGSVVAALQAGATSAIGAGRKVLPQNGTVGSQRFIRIDG